MATLAYRTLSNRAVEKLKVEKDTVFWDRELTGFGVRVYPSGGKVYVAQARGPDGPKRVTVGRHGVLGAEQARQRAAALIIARVKAGEAPRTVLGRYILPQFGKLPLTALERAQVVELHHRLCWRSAHRWMRGPCPWCAGTGAGGVVVGALRGGEARVVTLVGRGDSDQNPAGVGQSLGHSWACAFP